MTIVVGSALARFEVTLTKPATEAVHVNWRTIDGTAITGRDYAQNSGTVSFLPGEVTKAIEIFVHGRAVGTEDRVFYVQLDPPINAILADNIGACVIHVDTDASQPVLTVIIPKGERGLRGFSAYEIALQNGFVGSETEWLASLKPKASDLAPEVADLIDVGTMQATAEGTEALAIPDKDSVSGFARRIAYLSDAKIATAAALTAGENQIPIEAFSGDSVNVFNATGCACFVIRAGKRVDLPWHYIPEQADIFIKDAQAGDVPFLVEYGVGIGDISNVPLTASDETRALKDWLAEFAVVRSREEENSKALKDQADPAKGSAIIGRSAQQVASIADLRKLKKASASKFAYVHGYYKPGDAGGGEFFLDADDTTSTDNAGTVIVAEDGGRWKRSNTAEPQTAWFGAKGDRTTDDTAAVQAACDYCNSFASAKPLWVNGKCRLTASVNIDRPVDGTNGDFRIRANGDGSGFFTSSAIKMFSSRFPYGSAAGMSYTKTPVSEYTVFEGVNFEASTADIAAFVISDKHFRTTFKGCNFRFIRALENAEYTQTMAFIDNRMRGHKGVFFKSSDAYNLIARGNQFEAGGQGFQLGGTPRGAILCENLYEGSTGPFVQTEGGASLAINGNYFEGNASPDIILGQNGGAPNGVSIKSNIFFLHGAQAGEPSFYPVILGISDGVEMGGNVSSGHLCNNLSVKPFGLFPGKNVVGAGKNEFLVSPIAQGGIVARSGGGQASATPLSYRMNLVTGVAADGDSVLLPKVAIGAKIESISVANLGAKQLYVFPSPNERIIGAGYNSPFAIPPGTSMTFTRYDGESWAKI